MDWVDNGCEREGQKMRKNAIVQITKQQLIHLIDLIMSLAIDCSDHLEDQHNQTNPNDKPRFFFDNIAEQAKDLRNQILGESEKKP